MSTDDHALEEQLRKTYNDMDSDELMSLVIQGKLTSSALSIAQEELDKRANYDLIDAKSSEDVSEHTQTATPPTPTSSDSPASEKSNDSIQSKASSNSLWRGMLFSCLQLIPGLGTVALMFLCFRTYSKRTITVSVIAVILLIALLFSLSYVGLSHDSLFWYPFLVYWCAMALISLPIGLKFFSGLSVTTAVITAGAYYFILPFWQANSAS